MFTTFPRSLTKKVSETVVDRSKDGGIGQYAKYARKSIRLYGRCSTTLTIAADLEAKDLFGPNVKLLDDMKRKFYPENFFLATVQD
jgi:hypothetical protein